MKTLFCGKHWNMQAQSERGAKQLYKLCHEYQKYDFNSSKVLTCFKSSMCPGNFSLLLNVG